MPQSFVTNGSSLYKPVEWEHVGRLQNRAGTIDSHPSARVSLAKCVPDRAIRVTSGGDPRVFGDALFCWSAWREAFVIRLVKASALSAESWVVCPSALHSEGGTNGRITFKEWNPTPAAFSSLYVLTKAPVVWLWRIGRPLSGPLTQRFKYVLIKHTAACDWMMTTSFKINRSDTWPENDVHVAYCTTAFLFIFSADKMILFPHLRSHRSCDETDSYRHDLHDDEMISHK